MSTEPARVKALARWLLSLLPAGGAAYVYFKSHPVAVEIGCTLWVALTGFGAKVWKELEDEAVKGTANLLRALPGKAGQILARFWDWGWLKLTAWAPGYTNRYRKELRFQDHRMCRRRRRIVRG